MQNKQYQWQKKLVLLFFYVIKEMNQKIISCTNSRLDQRFNIYIKFRKDSKFVLY